MAPRKKPPAAVLVVDQTYGLAGVRRTGSRPVMPGKVVVLDGTLGPQGVPDDLVPTEIHFYQVAEVIGRLQAENLNEIVDLLLERMGILEHAHVSLFTNSSPTLLEQGCRCGAARSRPRGPHDWSDWAIPA